MKKIILTGAGVITFFPAIVLAQTTIQNIVIDIGDIIGLATPIVVALALLYFFWGLAKYILNSGDEEKKAEGKSIMIWGIIALFVMVSVWGLVNLVADTFNIDQTNIVVPPAVQTP